MNAPHKEECDRLRAALRQLFQDAGYEMSELLRIIDFYEREGSSERSAARERLEQEVIRLRRVAAAKTAGAMSSRLKDALRE